MAKRRRRKIKTARRRSSFRPRSFRRRSKSSGANPKTQDLIMSGMAYGALRERLSIFVDQVTGSLNLPFNLGGFGDEILLGGLAWAVKKNVRNKNIKMIANAGILLESARIGEALTQQLTTQQQVITV